MPSRIQLKVYIEEVLTSDTQHKILKAIEDAGGTIEFVQSGLTESTGPTPMVYKVHLRSGGSAKKALCGTNCHPTRVVDQKELVTCKLCQDEMEAEQNE
jgi:hypothetical protein